MSYHGKDFVEVYDSLGNLRRKIRIETDLANKRLEQIRSEITPAEYYTLKMRIRQKPISMPKIADLLAQNGLKGHTVTRQNVERMIKKVLKNLLADDTLSSKEDDWAEFGDPENFIMPYDDEII